MKYWVSGLSVLLLVIGVIAGTKLLGGEQRVKVAAGQGLGEVAGVKFDSGETEVTFVYVGEIRNGVQVYLEDELKWVPVKVNSVGGNRYQIAFGKMIKTGEQVKIRVNGQEAKANIRDINQ